MRVAASMQPLKETTTPAAIAMSALRFFELCAWLPVCIVRCHPHITAAAAAIHGCWLNDVKVNILGNSATLLHPMHDCVIDGIK